jgi:hypothetical protein
MRSTPIPKRSHQTASLLRLNKAWAEEGHAVIAADVGRQAAFLKKPLKYGESIVFAGGGESLASQEKTAGVIRDRQRIAVLTIAEPELALVVRAPQFIETLA